ncbi:MAG TPA: NDP-sugar synthase [Ilumatobacter sp.]|nr:NDP-sugar synthase [Ilumatobacter sp.]
MYAVVLVGGFGTRLHPLTYDVPKPMLPVVHRPMIVRLVERLAPAGVTDVVLALGFKPEPFAAAFPDGTHALPDGGSLRVHYAVEPEPLDTAGAIAFAARSVGIDSTFVVANGDVLTDLRLPDLLAAHRASGRAATIHLTPVPDPSAFGVVEHDPDGTVRRFVEKPAPGETDSNLISAGTYVFEPEVLDLIATGERVSVERDTFPKLVADGRLGAYATDDYWIDTGRPELYLAANLDLIDGRRRDSERAIAAGAHIHADACVEGSVVDAGTVVEAYADVRRSVLLPGARVCQGAIVADSIVAGEVGAGATLANCVVGAGYTVAGGVELAAVRLPE